MGSESQHAAELVRLDWTGNHFLAPEIVRAQVETFARSQWNPTMRADRSGWELRAAIGRRLGVNSGTSVLTTGSAAGIDAYLRALAPLPIVHVVPDFHQAALVAARDGRTYLPIAVAPESELVTTILKGQRGRAVLVLSSPSNPLGRSATEADVRALLNSWDGPVLIDEAYADFARDTAVRLTEEFSQLTVSRTFSKAWGLADLRLGCLIGSGVGTTTFRDFTESLFPSSAAIAAAMALLSSPQRIDDSIAATVKARERLIGQLTDMGIEAEPSSANFLTLFSQRAADLEQFLDSRGVRVKRVGSLRLWPAQWADGIRVSVCPEPQNERLTDGLAAWLRAQPAP